ncbi:MAG: NADPH:quinone oxidoreductase family protein [Caulobacterales bacterium]|nr:NADPH:quinone oxidoreductase family protein [Caulobacterales bacterium]
MRALQVTTLSEAFEGVEIVTAPTPALKAGESLVRVRAAALGFPGLLMTRGAYQHRPDTPFIFGGDFAGEVVAAGEGADIAIGARVAGGAVTGSFAEYLAAPTQGLLPIPERVSFTEAACFPSAYVTAHVSLVHAARIEAGEWVMVLGGAGGVGLAAVDLARALGAKVIAGASSEEKRAALRAYAPDALVIDTAKPFKDVVREISGGGVNVVFDPVGGDVFAEAMSCLAFAGRMLVIGFASGDIPTLSVNRALIKHASVIGVRAGEFSRRFPEKRRETTRQLMELWSRGVLRPRVDTTLPLEAWREGVERVTSRVCVGRVILKPGLDQ